MSGKQDPLTQQLSPQSDLAASAGLNVPRQRQNPLLRQLSPQPDDAAGSGGLVVPPKRPDPLQRGLQRGQQNAGAGLELDPPQVTTRKVNKDGDDNEESEGSSLFPPGGRKQPDFPHRARLPTEPPGDDAAVLSDLEAILGTRGPGSGAAEKLRLPNDPGTVIM